MTDQGIYSIGDWTFDPAGAELRRGDERRRLEHRTARTLDVLAARRGEVVSHDEIVAAVWNGRHLSPNSIPVVIGDLRRALGDDARDPRYIETVAKRGYRLVGGANGHGAGLAAVPPGPARPSRRLNTGALVGLALLAVAGFVGWRALTPAPANTAVAVYDVSNATGEARYDEMAGKVSELVAANLGRAPDLAIVRNGQPKPGRARKVVRLDGKLILWTGTPTVMFTAADTRSGEVAWNGMAAGPEPRFPATVAEAMGKFSAKLSANQKPPAQQS